MNQPAARLVDAPTTLTGGKCRSDKGAPLGGAGGGDMEAKTMAMMILLTTKVMIAHNEDARRCVGGGGWREKGWMRRWKRADGR